MTASEIAACFNIPVHRARIIIHSLMRRNDGLRARLAARPALVKGEYRLVKFFSVSDLPAGWASETIPPSPEEET